MCLYMIVHVLLSLLLYVTYTQNILKYRRSTAASPLNSKGWKSINTQHQKVHHQRPRSNVEEMRAWVRSMNDNEVALRWEVDEVMLTYSWLMASVVFSKGHKANSNGLETGPDGWSELEKERGVGKNKNICMLQLKTKIKSKLKLE